MNTIYIASDHAGFALKHHLITFLSSQGYLTIDLGPMVFDTNDDYPDYVMPLARTISLKNGSLGIVIGLSGEGEAIAANRIVGVRAAVFYGGSLDILKLSRAHNNSNILSLGASFLSEEAARDAVHCWITTPFSDQERHIRRNKKLDCE